MTSVCEALSHNRDAVGIGRKGTIDKPYLLKAPFWTVDTLFYAIPKPDINLEFALCSFLNVDWKSKDESTGLPSLSKEAINETVLRVPNAVEQNHLGSFFTDLDSLITLHQRKRCNGPLTHPLVWEQRKLGEIIQLGGSGGTPSATNPNYYGGEIPFLGIADIEGRDIAHTAKTLTKEGLRNSAAWIVPAGAVSLAMYASVGKVGIIRQDTATSQAFYNMIFEDVAIRDFVFTRLEKADASFEWEPYISTGTQRNLNADKVKAFAIAVPGSREAAKIGRYFANLDFLITLHQ